MASGAGVLAGRALRGGRWSLLGLALVVALGGGASITAAGAAHRTDHAYGGDQLGVIPRTSVPLSWLALEVLLTVALGWLAVAIPAHAAARLSPTDALAAR